MNIREPYEVGTMILLRPSEGGLDALSKRFPHVRYDDISDLGLFLIVERKKGYSAHIVYDITHLAGNPYAYGYQDPPQLISDDEWCEVVDGAEEGDMESVDRLLARLRKV